MTRRTTLILSAILVIAFALRLIQLSERDFWYDEAFSVLFAETGVESMLTGTTTITPNGASEPHPLLYYTALHYWMWIVGQSPFAVRLFNVLIGLVTIYAVFLLSRDLFDTRIGLSAAFITAIAPFHIQYSQEARMYSLLALFLVLATWTFWRAYRIEKRAVGWWIAFGVFGALTLYTQQLGAFYLAALACVPIIARRWHALPGLLTGIGVAVIFYAPWLFFVLPNQLVSISNAYWIPVPSIASLLVTLRSFATVNLTYGTPSTLIGLGAALILLFFMILQLLLRTRRVSATTRDSLLFALWLFIAPIALLWVVSQLRPLYIDRALIGSALMLYVLLAWLLTRGGLPRPISFIVGGIGIIAVGIGLFYQYTWSNFPSSPFQAMTTQITQQWLQGDVIIHQDKLSALPSRYYARDLTQRYIRDEPGAADDTLSMPAQQTLNFYADACVRVAARGAERVWWVVLSPTPAQYALIQELFTTQIAWLEASFAARETYQLNDVIFTLYSNRMTPLDEGVCES